MPLTLHVISQQSRTMGPAATCQIGEQGGTIGRVASNDWVLPDPERFVSSHHAAVSFDDGCWYLQDTSVNGTFVNDQTNLIGAGNTVPLNDGDHIYIGDFEIMVGISGATTTGPSMHAAPIGGTPYMNPVVQDPAQNVDPLAGFDSGAADPFASGITGGGASPPAALPTDPFASPAAPAEDSLDPLAGFDSPDAVPAQAEAPWPAQQPAAQSDHVSPLEEHFTVPPQGLGSIGDDWDVTNFTRSSTSPEPEPPPVQVAPPQALPPQAPPPQAPPPQAPPPQAPPPQAPPPQAPPPQAPPAAAVPPPAAPPMQHPSGTYPAVNPSGVQPALGAGGAAPTMGGAVDTTGLSILLTAMGVDPNSMPPQAAGAVFQLSGHVFREVVQGMLEVLHARDELKSGLRIQRTQIQPVKNNPLKFSVTADEAVHKLLFPDNQGYMAPVEAIREAIDDIKAHQLAMMAGLRAAITSIMKQFDPDVMEKGFDRAIKRGGALGGLMGKKKYWEMYRERYEEISGDSADSILRLYGEDFAKAYQEQLDKI